jgi:hypothetical protein
VAGAPLGELALSCTICNSSWKGTLFPVAEDPRPPLVEGEAYTPLLLHPYDLQVDPEEHLTFNGVGGILPRGSSLRGRRTIETVGLDRPSLTQARAPGAGDADRWCSRLLNGARHGRADEVRQAAEDLWKAGGPERPFAGVVRARIREILGTALALSWLDMERVSRDPSWLLA